MAEPEPIAGRTDFAPVMAEVRRRMLAGEVPEPVEGEVVDRCEVCGEPSTYAKTPIGWRIRPPIHDPVKHGADPQRDLELQPPKRTDEDWDE